MSLPESKKHKISIIKTDAGKCFISDCEAKEGYNYNYHNTKIEGLKFDGKEPKLTFAKHWFEIPAYPQSIQAVRTNEKTNQRYELIDKDLESDKLPLVIPRTERDQYSEGVIESLYRYQSDTVPDYLVDFDCELVLVCEVENFRDAPEFNYPAIRRISYDDVKYNVVNQNVKHSLVDCIILPAPLRANSPCEISSKDMFDIVRQHVRDNIKSSVSRITSDYDFCFEVKKIVPLLQPVTFTYTDYFARTKKGRSKIHYKTSESKEHKVFEMTHAQQNYKGYTPIQGFKASNEWELKEMIDTFLSDLMTVINTPLTQCKHCNGTGYTE